MKQDETGTEAVEFFYSQFKRELISYFKTRLWNSDFNMIFDLFSDESDM